MTVNEEKEICREFKEAKDKAGMILILSQLKDCKREDIVTVLEKYGFEDPRKKNGKPPRPRMPAIVRTSLEEKMEKIDERIKELDPYVKEYLELEKQYKEIAQYLCS